MPPSLLDTNILSAVMRNRPAVIPHAQAYLAAHGRFTFSIITRYEILRGLKAKGAATQLAAFEQLCAASDVVPLTDAVVVLAADIYADLHRRRELIGDADTLIAATALEHGLTVVTDNTVHFARVADLPLQNWLRP